MIFEKQFSQWIAKLNRLERKGSELSPAMLRPIQPRQIADQSYFDRKNPAGMQLNSPFLQKKESEGHPPTMRPSTTTMEHLTLKAEPKKAIDLKVDTVEVDAIKVEAKNVQKSKQVSKDEKHG